MPHPALLDVLRLIGHILSSLLAGRERFLLGETLFFCRLTTGALGLVRPSEIK